MNMRMWKGILGSEEATITFPTTLAKVQTEMRGLEEFGKSYGPVSGVCGEGPAQVLNRCVKVDDLNTEAGIQNLNRLAEVIDRMGSERLNLLSGALALEQAKDLNDVLHIIGSLDQYEIFPKIGAEQRKVLGGMYTPYGMVKCREALQVQEEQGVIHLTLAMSKNTFSLSLPAGEDRLEQAKRALEIEDFSQASITAVKFSSPHLAGLLPLDAVSVEDANTLALCLQEMEQESGELKKFCAVLEVE